MTEIFFSICSPSDEVFSNTFDNPMYGSVAPKKDSSFDSNSIKIESKDDRIYEEIKS